VTGQDGTPSGVPHSDTVPDKVLEELGAAFSAASEQEQAYDFDDPSIDRLLGLGESADVSPDEPEVPQAAAPERKLIVIAEDDQPDAVYLDDETEQRHRAMQGSTADESGERSTIVISDLDDSSAVDVSAGSAGGSMDPRLRARRVAVRRAEGRRRLVWVGVAVGIVLVVVAAAALLASSLFDVTTIDVEGAVYTDPVALQAVIDDLTGEPILLVDTQDVEARLESIPWVESARVSTDFPHRVVIEIREREPVATFEGTDGRFRVIDRDGRVLDVIVGRPIAYMLVTGTNPDTDQGLFAGPPYAAVAQLVIALPPEIRAITESVGVDAATGDMSLLLDGGVEVQLGGASRMQDKLARLLQKVREGLDGVVRIDVSTDEVSVTKG